MTPALDEFEREVAHSIIAVDTIWGGDVNCRSGTGRVIADSYFSGKPLPDCYRDELAVRLRKSGGVSAKQPDRDSIRAFLRRTDPLAHIEKVEAHARTFDPLRRDLVLGLADALRMQLELALECIGDGPVVDYDRCVVASTGQVATSASTKDTLPRVGDLLKQLGARVPTGRDGLLEAVDGYRTRTWIGQEGIAKASDRVIAELSALTDRHVAPWLPPQVQKVPRANVTFQLLDEAWFSGSMNYIGRERLPDGSPAYEAEYEINGAIQKSEAEFVHLVAHEVVPGHVTTFALVQYLYHHGLAGFEVTVPTMNTRHSTLFEGIANAGLLMAYGVRSVDALPLPELQLGFLLSQLEDDAKTNASYFTYVDKMPADEIKDRLRHECLVTPERAQKLTDAWARHPLMGRAYMPSYRIGTSIVLDLLAHAEPADVIPALYGMRGICDCVTIRRVIGGPARAVAPA